MFPEDMLHRINNQLAVILGRAELLACLAPDQRSRDNCADIALAVQRITELLDDVVDHQFPESASRPKQPAPAAHAERRSRAVPLQE